jgi:beta-glucosidase/6-phospho-beta-glucosidase/beta-galactosidase
MDLPNLEKSLDKVKELGATFIRVDFGWSIVQPQPWSYNALKYRRVVDACKARDIGVIAVIGASGGWPDWAKSSYRGDYHSIASLWYYYCNNIAKEFGNDIYYYQILNEENPSRSNSG